MNSPTFLQRHYFLMVVLLGLAGAAVIVFGTVVSVLGLQLLQDLGFAWRRLIGFPVFLLGAMALVSAIRLGQRNLLWIDASDRDELENWAKKLKIPMQRLMKAIEAVGAGTKDIRRYLAETK